MHHRHFNLFLLVITASLFFARAIATSTSHSPRIITTSGLKRNYLSCFQTYGGGSIPCGDPGQIHFCYDPTLGESCCPLDGGYCLKGDFCAAVAGYCCHEGEDDETCAQRLGSAVELPAMNGSSLLLNSTYVTMGAATDIPTTSTTMTLTTTSTISVTLVQTTSTASARLDGITAASNVSGGGLGLVGYEGKARKEKIGLALAGLVFVPFVWLVL